ncbi:MAG TPA: hypothetical protein VMJ32_02795 [Pirellulales bacterium]|nr:hypothetical protein [Pirellulales bacterium]
MADLTLLERANEYARVCGIRLDLQTPLGHGTDGSVWKSSRKTAVKALFHSLNYTKERICYQRFADAGITKLLNFSVPQLVGFNDELQVVEMKLVNAPFILDFAKAYIDQPPEFSAEVWRDWEQQGQELFESRWSEVKKLLSSLKQFGIHYLDAKLGNIMFEDWPSP